MIHDTNVDQRAIAASTTEDVYLVWKADTADNRYEFATDTFLLQNGKIVTQTFAGKIVPKRLPR